ncbi:MAG: cation:dicarboxylase symporter family transporter [Spirochaetes bacterium]|nr:cation:dicarboxylase symporter family transporter [Spirochaetota bacterium]
MKIWFKLLLGTILGSVLGFVLSPGGNGAVLVQHLGRVSLHFGRYLVMPIMFFSLVVAVYELRLQRKVLQTFRLALFYGASMTAGMVVLGVILVLLLSPERIPIIATPQIPLQIPSFWDLVLRLLPTNSFLVFVEQGDYFLPLLFLAFVIGLNLTSDRQIARSVIELSDSLNRVFWHINVFITEFLYVPVLFLSCSLVLRFRTGNDLGIFLPVVVAIVILTMIVAFIGLPMALYFFHQKRNPLRWMHAQWGPGIAALVSGDILFSYGQLVRHGNEVLGIPRRIGAVTSPFLLIFSRSGSAFVTVVTFLVLFRSYSSLELGLFQTLWVIFLSVLVSFTLWAAPGMGSFVGIALLCKLFSRGMEEGFLILTPVVPILVSLGAFLDVLCASLVSQWVAERMECIHPEEERHSI